MFLIQKLKKVDKTRSVSLSLKREDTSTSVSLKREDPNTSVSVSLKREDPSTSSSVSSSGDSVVKAKVLKMSKSQASDNNLEISVVGSYTTSVRVNSRGREISVPRRYLL